MTVLLPTSTIEIASIEKLVELAVVLPAQTAIEAVGTIRAMFQMLQDFVWETAITSVEGVLALGAFNLLVSFSLAMWVAPAVRTANILQAMLYLKTASLRYYGAAHASIFGPQAIIAQLPAALPPKEKS